MTATDPIAIATTADERDSEAHAYWLGTEPGTRVPGESAYSILFRTLPQCNHILLDTRLCLALAISVILLVSSAVLSTVVVATQLPTTVRRLVLICGAPLCCLLPCLCLYTLANKGSSADATQATMSAPERGVGGGRQRRSRRPQAPDDPPVRSNLDLERVVQSIANLTKPVQSVPRSPRRHTRSTDRSKRGNERVPQREFTALVISSMDS